MSVEAVQLSVMLVLLFTNADKDWGCVGAVVSAAGVTVTDAVALAVPPAPVQLSV